jgi:hypothetical protein
MSMYLWRPEVSHGKGGSRYGKQTSRADLPDLKLSDLCVIYARTDPK